MGSHAVCRDLDPPRDRLEQTLEFPTVERKAFLAARATDFLTSPAPRPAALDVIEPIAQETGDDPGVPEAIGGYRIVRLLGYGGMAMVYEALQSHPRRTVALKLLCPGSATDGLARRFASEAELMGRLDHPGIPRVLAAGVEEITDPVGTVSRLPFIAMEYVRGECLDRYAGRSHRSLRSRLRVFARVCDAVHHAHGRGVVHRDLKPANILVEEGGQPKILDFGIARLAKAGGEDPTRLTSPGQIVGSLPYMSPEQLDGDRHCVDACSDVYSLGVVLYEMLAGRLPIEVSGLPLAEAALAFRDTEPTPLGQLTPTLSGDLETIVARAMAKDRRRRYPSAADLAADLRRYLHRRPILARAPAHRQRLPKRTRRRRGLLGGVVALLMAAGLLMMHLGLGPTRLGAGLDGPRGEGAPAPLAAGAEDARPVLEVPAGWDCE